MSAESKFLVLGATGKTGRRVVAQLRAMGAPLVAASRAGSGAVDGVDFEWSDPRSHAPALEGVSAVYLVAPTSLGGDPAPMMIDFIQRAMEREVRRFVLLSASLLPRGGPAMGAVHAWLAENAPEWAVLRPSWFMQNFSEALHAQTIQSDGAIYSATGEGRVGFVDADDIAACAAATLTGEPAPNRDYVLTGPGTLSYADVAAQISQASGAPVRHVNVSQEELIARLTAGGAPAMTAAMLAMMDGAIATGAEDRTTDDVLAATGRPPRAFAEFAALNRTVWRRGA